jgi:hypothetical protein
MPGKFPGTPAFTQGGMLVSSKQLCAQLSFAAASRLFKKGIVVILCPVICITYRPDERNGCTTTGLPMPSLISSSDIL